MKTLQLFLNKYVLVGMGGVAAIAFALAVSAETGPAIAVTIHSPSHATTTEAAIGTLVHAKAHVATSTDVATPTGTVDFTVYEGMSCSGAATTHAEVPLVNGIAESSATVVPAAGLSYRVTYNGDANNVSSQSSCTALTATAADTSLSMSLSSTTVRTGASVTGTATLNNETSNATGTVLYTVYSNSSCSANARNAGTKTVLSGAVPQSDSIQFNSVGTFYWQAVYSGDQHNEAATSSCASGKLNVLATSTPDNGGKGNNGKHKGWVFGLPFGILKKVFNDIGLPQGMFERFEERFDDADLVDLKMKIREAKESRDRDEDEGDDKKRKDAKDIRKEMQEKAKEARERAKEERKKDNKQSDGDEDDD